MNNENKTLPSLDVLFPFDYEGGGYFRQKGVAKYVKAEVLHGMEAVEYLYERIKEYESTGNNTKEER